VLTTAVDHDDADRAMAVLCQHRRDHLAEGGRAIGRRRSSVERRAPARDQKKKEHRHLSM
jgi:hypothetical protein